MQVRSLMEQLLQTNTQFNSDELELNHSALALLLKHEFRDKFDKSQIFIAAGSEDLRALLPRLKLNTDGDEAFILVRPYIHSMVVYLRRTNEQLNCFIFDSQNWGLRYYPIRLIIDAIAHYNSQTKIYLSGSEIQAKNVQRGCSEYSLACMDFLCKSGCTLFDNIEKYQHQILVYEGISFSMTNEKIIPFHWPIPNVQEMHNHYLRILDEIIKCFYTNSDNLDQDKIQLTINEIQGCNELLTDIHHPSLYDMSVNLARNEIAIQFKNKDIIYSNFLIFSKQIYPSHVDLDNSQCLFSLSDDIQFDYDRNKHSLIFRARNITSLIEEIRDLHKLVSSFSQHTMRQQLALSVFSDEVEQAVEFTKLCLNDVGGFDQRQIQYALQYYFKSYPEVYVPSYSDLAGSAYALDLKELKDKHYQCIAFSFHASDIHQIGILVTLDESIYRVSMYDSLGSDKPLNKAHLNRLKSLLGGEKYQLEIINAPIHCDVQTDDWSCGVRVVWNVVKGYLNLYGDIIHFDAESEFDINKFALNCYKAYKIESQLQKSALEKTEINHRLKQLLLDLIEEKRYRGRYFLNNENVTSDVLKPIANYLQIMLWGNLNRGLYPGDNENRSNESNEKDRTKSFFDILNTNNGGFDKITKTILSYACLFSEGNHDDFVCMAKRLIDIICHFEVLPYTKMYRDLTLTIATELELALNKRLEMDDKYQFIKSLMKSLLMDAEIDHIFDDFFSLLDCDNYVAYYQDESISNHIILIETLNIVAERGALLEQSLSSEHLRLVAQQMERDKVRENKIRQVKAVLDKAGATDIDESQRVLLADNLYAYRFVTSYIEENMFASIPVCTVHAILDEVMQTRLNFNYISANLFLIRFGLTLALNNIQSNIKKIEDIYIHMLTMGPIFSCETMLSLKDIIQNGADISLLMPYVVENEVYQFVLALNDRIENFAQCFLIWEKLPHAHANLSFLDSKREINSADAAYPVNMKNRAYYLDFLSLHTDKIVEYTDVYLLLSCTPRDMHVDIIKEQKDKIKNCAQWQVLIDRMHKNDRLAAMTVCQDAICDGYDLNKLIWLLPKHQRLQFVMSHCEKIRNNKEWNLIKMSLSQNDIAELSKVYNPNCTVSFASALQFGLFSFRQPCQDPGSDSPRDVIGFKQNN